MPKGQTVGPAQVSSVFPRVERGNSSLLHWHQPLVLRPHPNGFSQGQPSHAESEREEKPCTPTQETFHKLLNSWRTNFKTTWWKIRTLLEVESACSPSAMTSHCQAEIPTMSHSEDYLIPSTPRQEWARDPIPHPNVGLVLSATGLFFSLGVKRDMVKFKESCGVVGNSVKCFKTWKVSTSQCHPRVALLRLWYPGLPAGFKVLRDSHGNTDHGASAFPALNFLWESVPDSHSFHSLEALPASALPVCPDHWPGITGEQKMDGQASSDLQKQQSWETSPALAFQETGRK